MHSLDFLKYVHFQKIDSSVNFTVLGQSSRVVGLIDSKSMKSELTISISKKDRLCTEKYSRLWRVLQIVVLCTVKSSRLD